MSDFRFGDDYRLNYDFEHQEEGFQFGWDYLDWGKVEWVEIEDVFFVQQRTSHKLPGKMKYGTRIPKCSICGQSLGDDRWNYCPECGGRIDD